MTNEIMKLRNIAAIAVPASLAFSYFYDMGTFYALGIPLSQTPIGVTDHLQGWLVWIPLALLTLGVPCLLVFLAGGTKGPERSEAAAPASSPNSSSWNGTWNVMGFLLPALAGAMAIVASEFGRPFFIALTAAYLWILLIRFKSVRGARSRLSLSRGVLAGVPAVLAVAFGLGWQAARHEVLRIDPTHRVYIPAAGNDATDEDLRVVRVFENWMLVLDADDAVVWMSLSPDAKLRQLRYDDPLAGLFCTIGVHCPAN